MRTVFLAALLAAAPLAAQAQPANRLLSAGDLSQLSPHVWMIKGGPNIGIVVGDRITLVVDTGLGRKNGEIVSQVARRLSTRGQKLYLTTTHYHAEHATGDDGFPADTVLLRPRVQQAEMDAEGQKLVDLFRSRSAQDRELLADLHDRTPNILFDDSYHLDLGGVKVGLYWYGPAHTKGDMVVMIEPDSVLISGDVVQNRAGPYFYCADCTPAAWLKVLDRVAALKPKIILPDHSPPGDGGLIASERAILSDLAARTAALKAQGKSLAETETAVEAEFAAKYAGWSSLNHLREGIDRAYAAD